MPIVRRIARLLAMGLTALAIASLFGCAASTAEHPVVVTQKPRLVVAGGRAVPGKRVICGGGAYSYVYGFFEELTRDGVSQPRPGLGYRVARDDVGHVLRCVDFVTGSPHSHPLHIVVQSAPVTVAAH